MIEEMPFPIVTSYFGNRELAFDSERRWTFFSVALGTPQWFPCKAQQLKDLFPVAPTPKLLGLYKSGKVNDLEYTEIYLERLQRELDVFALVGHLKLSSPNPPILLCWEKPDEFCHRHLLSRYLVENVPDLYTFELITPRKNTRTP